MNDNIKDFKKPLGVFVEEDTPVRKHAYDPERKRIITTTEIEKTKVMYIHAPKVKIRCKDGEHQFKVVDIHRYLFQCKKCPFVRKVYPTTYEFDEASGALIHRITGHRV